MRHIPTCYRTLLDQLIRPKSFHLPPSRLHFTVFSKVQTKTLSRHYHAARFLPFPAHTQPSREAQMFAELERLLLAEAASPAAAERCGGKS